jgi:hypothetical protein
MKIIQVIISVQKLLHKIIYMYVGSLHLYLNHKFTLEIVLGCHTEVHSNY